MPDRAPERVATNVGGPAIAESFEEFLRRNLRHAPLVVGTVLAFFGVRATGTRAGAILALAAGFALVPFAFLRPEIGLYALLFNSIAAIDSYYELQSFIPISIPILLDAAVGLGILLQYVLPGRFPRLYFAQNSLLLAYVALVTLSCAVSDVSVPNLWESFRTGFLIRPILYLFLIILVRTPTQIHRALVTFLVAFAMLMIMAGLDWLQKGGGFYRVSGSLGQSNLLSYVCIATLPMLICLTLYLRARAIRFAVLGLAVVTLFIAFQTLSRSGYFALAATLIFLVSRLARNPRTFFLALGFAVLFYAAVPDELQKRLDEVEDIRDTSRYRLSRIGYRMAADNPVLGVGWHAYNTRFPEYDYEGFYNKQKAPHSLYLAIAAQSGLPALVLYLTIYVITLYQTFAIQDRYRIAGDLRSLGFYLAVAIEAGLIGHFVFGLAGSYQDSYFAYLLLGLAVILVRYHHENPDARLT